MRDYLVFGIVFALLPFILMRPVVGILAYTWLSLMNPHRLTYGAAFDFPFAALVGGLTLVSLLLSPQPKRLPPTAAVILMVLFFGWMTFTSFFALEPLVAWQGWDKVMKTFLMVLITMLALNSEKDVKALAWVMGLSLGFFGLKGGLFTLIGGGTNRVWGPQGSYIHDNNDLALALVIAIPILWYLQMQAGKKWLKLSLIGAVLFTMVAAVGTYSRGAMLAGAAMLFFLWLKSRQKLWTALGIIIMIPFVLMLMPEQWFDRMASIGDYKADDSALGRFNAWGFALNLARDHLIGGGFNVFTPRMFLVYAPDPSDFHVAHSIYFRVIGEHGFFGLLIFLTLMLCAWRSGTRIIRFCKDKPELKWAHDLAAMCQVSIIGYAVGGAFLSLSYYDFYYYIIALLYLLEKLFLLKQPKKARKKIAAPLASVDRPSPRSEAT